MGCGKARGKDERLAVPAMPMPLAVVCCVLNFLIPGLGTAIAGLSAFCCSRNEDMSGSARCGSCCISFLFGFLQLLLTAACLIGWVWSCAWGIFMIGMSAEYYHNNPAEGDRSRPGGVVSPSVVVISQPVSSGGYGYPAPLSYGPVYHGQGQFPHPQHMQQHPTLIPVPPPYQPVEFPPHPHQAPRAPYPEPTPSTPSTPPPPYKE